LERVLTEPKQKTILSWYFLISDHTGAEMTLLKLSQDEQTLILLVQNNRSGFDIFTRDLPAWEQLVSTRV